jgi:hypothetical protein
VSRGLGHFGARLGRRRQQPLYEPVEIALDLGIVAFLIAHVRKDNMTWPTLDSADQLIIDEIERQTHRGAALVASAFIEAKLKRTISRRLDPTPDVELEGRAFSHNGPLNTFSQKILMGYMLQIYPSRIWNLLDGIRDLRNDFAHSTEILDFETPTIRDRCDNLYNAWGQAIGAGAHHLFYIQGLVNKYGVAETAIPRARDVYKRLAGC